MGAATRRWYFLFTSCANGLHESVKREKPSIYSYNKHHFLTLSSYPSIIELQVDAAMEFAGIAGPQLSIIETALMTPTKKFIS